MCILSSEIPPISKVIHFYKNIETEMLWDIHQRKLLKHGFKTIETP